MNCSRAADGPRAWAAEAAGTALLLFGGLSAIALAGPGRPLLAGALFGSCVTIVATSRLGKTSGAHLNPAVTLAFRGLGRISSRDAGAYVVAQLLGAVCGSLAYRVLFGTVPGGVTHTTVPAPAAILFEAAMTAVLIVTILAFSSRERLMAWTPVAIVPVIAVLVWLGGSATGASLNPARSGGPAIAFGDYGDLWLYAVAPLLGALAAVAPQRKGAPHSRSPGAMKMPG